MSGVEFPLTDGMIDFLVAELPDAACRDLLRELLRERRANGGDAVGRAALEFLRVEVARELREIRATVGTPVADGLPEPGERVQIILDAVRGPQGDRWIVEEPWPRLIADEVVTAWRPKSAPVDVHGERRDD